MAMVLDAFAAYVQNMLTEMVKEEVHMLLGVGDKIDKIGVKLKDLKNFLADADKRNITDKSVQEWVGQLKQVMYEAADILDLCQLKAMERGESTVNVGCFNPLLFCMRNPSHAHNIGTRIKALNKRLDTIKERSTALNFINLGSYEDCGSKVHGSQSCNTRRETSGGFDRSSVVGEKIEQDTRKLVEIMLTEKEGNTNIMVVAVVGVGGIGKTTLAQKVFNDEALNNEFEKLIWLSINKDFDKVELLRTIITQAGGVHGGEKVLAVLQPILATTLEGKKLFLVLDDVWNHEAWGDVLKPLLANVVARGSQVLVTTRDERVARAMKAVFPYHNVDKLEEEDAWSLLKKQIISSETNEREIDMLKDIGVQIVAKCDGLPLTVKVMGGLLCQKDKIHREWKMVLDDSIWSTSGLPEELNHAVYLSYEDLPSSAKQCLLYYSLLPKTSMFIIDEIIGMWISEGFLHGTSDDLEETGRKYYKELILRNLIEPNTKYVDQCVCGMHDVVRSFGQFVARDEALAAHGGETNIVNKLGAHEFLRLSLESKASESDGLDWSSLQAQKTLRVLISVGYINIKPGDSLVHFPCLRTLHIESADVVALLESLHKLNHLRMQKLIVENCPKVKVLKGVRTLQRLILVDRVMETLPEYMGGINPMHLELYCSLSLLASIAAGQFGLEWDKFSHVKHVKAYAREGDNTKKWYVLYTADPYNLTTNVSYSFMSRGTLTYFEDTQRFESLYKMTRKTFSYICSLVMGASMEDMNSYTFVDGRVLSLEDRVAVALKRLHSSEPTETIGSSIGVNDSTILLVTQRFAAAMCERAKHHLFWPDSNEMDNIKSMFGKIHNMHNCCGVICTTHIPFGPNCDHEKDESTQMQFIVDPEIRFRNIWLGPASGMSQSSLLQDSLIFKECEKGNYLNGSKLKLTVDGSEVGEYIIGDEGYPLLPWLLTPYEEKDLSDSKGEFNRRHSAATTCALKAMVKFKDTWKFLEGETSCPANLNTQSKVICACCALHNIIIDMEDDAAMSRSASEGSNYCEEVRQLENEDAVRARDMLSQYFLTTVSSESEAGPVNPEDHEVVATGSRDENNVEKEQISSEEERQC